MKNLYVKIRKRKGKVFTRLAGICFWGFAFLCIGLLFAGCSKSNPTGPSGNNSSLGMEMSGVDSTLEIATIQSVRSFTPPFTVVANVMGAVSHGVTFGLAVSSDSGNEGICIAGNLNDSSGYPGIWDQLPQGLQQPWTGFMDALADSPSVNVWYQLTISVDSSDSGRLTVSASGRTLGFATRQVGGGPFYVLIVQREGLPVVGGANQAFWRSIKITSSLNSSGSLMNDDFTEDKSLNSNLWQVNGAVGDIVGPLLSNPPAVVVTPIVTFGH